MITKEELMTQLFADTTDDAEKVAANIIASTILKETKEHDVSSYAGAFFMGMNFARNTSAELTMQLLQDFIDNANEQV